MASNDNIPITTAIIVAKVYAGLFERRWLVADGRLEAGKGSGGGTFLAAGSEAVASAALTKTQPGNSRWEVFIVD